MKAIIHSALDLILLLKLIYYTIISLSMLLLLIIVEFLLLIVTCEIINFKFPLIAHSQQHTPVKHLFTGNPHESTVCSFEITRKCEGKPNVSNNVKYQARNY